MARQLAARAEKDAEAKKSKKSSEKMQWEAMKPTSPSTTATMDLDDAVRTTRSSHRIKSTTRSTRDFQGGKLLGVFKKTTKKQRKKQKNRLKRGGGGKK